MRDSEIGRMSGGVGHTDTLVLESLKPVVQASERHTLVLGSPRDGGGHGEHLWQTKETFVASHGETQDFHELQVSILGPTHSYIHYIHTSLFGYSWLGCMQDISALKMDWSLQMHSAESWLGPRTTRPLLKLCIFD